MKKNRFLALALSALMSAFALTACTTAADDTANAGTDAAKKTTKPVTEE